MPTFTTIALENLLEPRVRDSSSSFRNKPLKSADITQKPLISGTTKTTADDDGGEKRREVMKVESPASKHIYISPALYTTPEPAQIVDISLDDSPSPSPYVVNHKGRGGRRIGGFEIPSPVVETSQLKGERDLELELDSDLGKEDDEDRFSGVEAKNEAFEGVQNENENEADGDGDEDENENECFLDPFSGSSRFENHSFASAQADFFDANDEFSSDGSISSAPFYGRPIIESELRTMRLSLLEEIERRKTAEDVLNVMQTRWQRIGNLMAQAGLSFPAPPNAGDNMQEENASLEQLSQEIVVARFVADAIGKGEARAEAELASQAILESKEQEISRLRDRLQYYEAVNHEMSQRNQEIVEVSRRQRQKRKRQQKWLWSCIGLSIAVGASVVAYSYLPATSKHQPLMSSSDSADASSSISSSETA